MLCRAQHHRTSVQFDTTAGQAGYRPPGSGRLAAGVVEVLAPNAFTDDDRFLIESRPFFFRATADADGRPDCSHKGGLPGFVRVVEPDTLAFPDYDGNGMFKSLGNVLANP